MPKPLLIVGLPCFVKANRSSFGVTKVHQIEDLQFAIDIAFEHDDELIIESFLDGTEVSWVYFATKVK